MRLIGRNLTALVLLAGCLFLFSARCAEAKTELIPKIESFIVFPDYSGSMAMTYKGSGENKIALAQQFMLAMNGMIPDLGYQAAFATFAPYSLQYGPAAYDWMVMGERIAALSTDYDIRSRRTPMGEGLRQLGTVIDGMPKKLGVILLSDGESNRGVDPTIVARDIYNAYPKNVCFHIVSFADTADGQATLDSLAALNNCSVMVDGMELLEDEKMLKKFVADVFYEEIVVPEPVIPAPAPAPEPEVVEVITFRSITFDFDSAKIRSDMGAILDEAVSIIKGMSGDLVIEGHTCNIGTDAYNQGLSERRAASVRDYMIQNGVSAGRIRTIGFGETRPKFDNSTRDGRSLNRRVEIRIN